jgi:hypothetical protein
VRVTLPDLFSQFVSLVFVYLTLIVFLVILLDQTYLFKILREYIQQNLLILLGHSLEIMQRYFKMIKCLEVSWKLWFSLHLYNPTFNIFKVSMILGMKWFINLFIKLHINLNVNWITKYDVLGINLQYSVMHNVRNSSFLWYW